MTEVSPVVLINGILELLFEFVAPQVKYNIIRYQRDDAEEGREAFAQAEAKADKQHSQQQ